MIEIMIPESPVLAVSRSGGSPGVCPSVIVFRPLS